MSRESESLLARIGIHEQVDIPLTRLIAGQRVVVEPSMLSTPKMEPVAPPSVAGWREGRLQYSGEPLQAVIADINRYVDQPVVIADASLERLRVTGTVSERNIESWLTSLEMTLPVEVVTRSDGSLEIRARR